MHRLKRFGVIHKPYRVLRFVVFQAQLAWAAVRDRMQFPRAQRRIPLPPARLRYRVHGDLDAANFLSTGRTIAGNVRDLVASAGYDLAAFHNTLDFGCGCGRVLRHVAPMGLRGRVCGTDIDGQAIAWCQVNIPGVEWRTNQFLPPLHWPDAVFDFVFSISVFTHLTRDMQNAWLGELCRVIQPGGLLLLTIHGDFVQQTLPGEQRTALRESGMLYLTGSTGRLKLDGLPDFYQTAYHTRAYVEAEWSKLFHVIEIVPRGINAHQDAVLLRKR